VAYGEVRLLNSAPAMKAMTVLKMGWLLTSANMLRQYLEEYTGILADPGRRTVLRAGKRYLALNNDANRFIMRTHSLIPSFRRHMVVTADDAGREIIKSKYRIVFGGGQRTPLNDAEEIAVAEAAQKFASPDVMEALGASQAGQLDGIDIAVQSHRDGVLHLRSSWNGKGAPPPRIVVTHTPSHFKGYVEDELNGDSGRAALSDMYGRMFHDEDEPALRALAYLSWHQAAKDPKFLAGLDKKTLAKLEELYPPLRDDATSSFQRVWGGALRNESGVVEHHVEPIVGSKTGKLTLNLRTVSVSITRSPKTCRLNISTASSPRTTTSA
jgi:hypothetical protein